MSKRAFDEMRHGGTFLRTKDERATATWFERGQNEWMNCKVGSDSEESDSSDRDMNDYTFQPPPKDVWKDLKYGDLVMGKNTCDGTDTWCVTEDDIVCLKIEYNAHVPITISKAIEDPFAFFSNVTEDVTGQGISSVELLGEYHADVISRKFPGHNISTQSRVVWNIEEENAYEMSTPRAERTPCKETALVARMRRDNQQRTPEEDSRILRAIGVGGKIRVMTTPWQKQPEHHHNVYVETGIIKKLYPSTGNVLKVTVKGVRTLGNGDYLQTIVPATKGPFGGTRVWALRNWTRQLLLDESLDMNSST